MNEFTKKLINFKLPYEIKELEKKINKCKIKNLTDPNKYKEMMKSLLWIEEK